MENQVYQEYFNQGSLLLSNGNYEEAMKYFGKAEQEDPNHTELYIQMGIILVNQDRLDDAEKIFKKSLFVDKKCGEAQFHLGCIAGLKGDLVEAIKNVELAQNNGYNGEQTYFTLGMMYEEQGDVLIALRNYNKALVLNAVRPDIHLQKCNLLISEGRNEEALNALDSMIAYCPDYYEGYHLKCATLAELSRYDEAESTLNQGLELFPEEVGFKLDKAKIYIHQEKYNEAKKILDEIEHVDDAWKRDVILEKVRVAGLQDDYDETCSLLERAYKECRQNDKPDEEICYLLMSVYMTGKKYDEVIAMSQELLSVSKNTTYVNIASFYNAECLNEMGNVEEAKKVYEDTIKRCRNTALANPAALDAYLLRALSLNRLNQNDEALDMINYVVSLAPDSSEAHSAKAFILKSMGKDEEMEQEVQKVNELSSKLGTIMSAL